VYGTRLPVEPPAERPHHAVRVERDRVPRARGDARGRAADGPGRRRRRRRLPRREARADDERNLRGRVGRLRVRANALLILDRVRPRRAETELPVRVIAPPEHPPLGRHRESVPLAARERRHLARHRPRRIRWRLAFPVPPDAFRDKLGRDGDDGVRPPCGGDARHRLRAYHGAGAARGG